MIPKGLITYTLGDIEKIARRILHTRPDVSRSVPINVERLLEELPNVTIEYPFDLKIRHKVEGVIYKHFMSKDLTVYIDRSILRGPWDAYNAVLGEEFSHITLHMACFHMVHSVEDFIELQKQSEWSMYERDAKRLSEALRMPHDELDSSASKLYSHLVNQHGFGDPFKIERHLRFELAAMFRVLPNEMQRRLSEWPTQIRNRTLSSVLAQSDALLAAEWGTPTTAPTVQKPLFRNGAQNDG